MKRLALAVLCLMLCACCALAQADYPERPLTMIIPYGAGGTTDIYGRTLAALLEKELGQSISCVNQSGASGAIGAQFVKDADADGYTLLICSETMGTYRTMGVSELGYDDFTVITPLIGDPKIIVVGKNSPYNTMDELLAAIKEKPGRLTMSHSGPGGSGHNQGLVLGELGYDVAMISFGSGNESEPFVSGVSTRDEIVAAYGEPDETVSNNDLYEEIFYYEPFNCVSFAFRGGVVRQISAYYSANVYGGLDVDFALDASAMEKDAYILMSQYMDVTP